MVVRAFWGMNFRFEESKDNPGWTTFHENGLLLGLTMILTRLGPGKRMVEQFWTQFWTQFKAMIESVKMDGTKA